MAKEVISEMHYVYKPDYNYIENFLSHNATIYVTRDVTYS